jgi:hypothetical protein
LEAPARLTGAQWADASSDQPTARRATPLAGAELEQTAIQAKPDHDRANTDGQRGKQSELRRRIDHLGRIPMSL